ncbi:MAG: O-antigen ligase family protein [Defluviitaleaceae bacterium]|nr:O-antigen ligase family protein [Defluviitaleaceae bacterium]
MVKNTVLKINVVFIGLFIVFGNMVTVGLNLGGGTRVIPIRIGEVLLFLGVVMVISKYRFCFFNVRHVNLFIIWVVWAFITVLLNVARYGYSVSQLIFAILYPARFLGYIFIVYAISSFMVKCNLEIKSLTNLYILLYVAICVLGFIQLALFPCAIELNEMLIDFGVVIDGYDPHINRLTSTYIDPNFLGSVMVMPIMLTVSTLLSCKKDKIVNLVLLLVQLIALFLTVSRSGLISVFISFIVFFIINVKLLKNYIYLKKSLLIGAFMIFIFGAVYFTFNIELLLRVTGFAGDPSANARFENWAVGLEIASNYFFVGIGYNLLGAYNLVVHGISGAGAYSYGNDSSLLLVWMTTGIIGLTLYLIFIGFIYDELFKIRKSNDSYVSELANSLIASLTGSLVVSFFNNLLFYILWFFPFMLYTCYFIMYYKQKIKVQKAAKDDPD